MPRTNSYVCLDCHEAASRSAFWANRPPRCPKCTAPMEPVGNTQVPPKRDRRGWRRLLARLWKLTEWKRRQEAAAKPKPPLGRPRYQYQCEIQEQEA